MPTPPPPADAPPKLSLDEALDRLLAAVRPPEPGSGETVPLADALGRVLGADLLSPIDVPPADNSAMDGFAVRAAEAVVGAVLPVSQRIPAGAVPAPLAPGTAARIFTGGLVPAGADAVVMQEHCTVVEGQVRIDRAAAPGMAVRLRGEDVARGSTVLARGRRLDAAALGLAASVGAARLLVARRPRVALLSSGDELVEPGSVPPEQLPPGAIYNSNRTALKALIMRFGADCTDLGIVPDDREATRAALRAAADGHDLIVTSGGVSVGEEDHLKPAVEAEGALALWQVAIKPGKPLAFGHVRRSGARAGGSSGSAFFVGLPGNPVSSFITFLLAVRPLLLRLQGAPAELPFGLPARADFDWPRADPRREFLRARWNAAGGLDLFPHQGSGVLTSMAWADGLVDNPPGRGIARGDTVRFLPLATLLG